MIAISKTVCLDKANNYSGRLNNKFVLNIRTFGKPSNGSIVTESTDVFY